MLAGDLFRGKILCKETHYKDTFGQFTDCFCLSDYLPFQDFVSARSFDLSIQ